jgi:hypothetical protein
MIPITHEYLTDMASYLSLKYPESTRYMFKENSEEALTELLAQTYPRESKDSVGRLSFALTHRDAVVEFEHEIRGLCNGESVCIKGAYRYYTSISGGVVKPSSKFTDYKRVGGRSPTIKSSQARALREARDHLREGIRYE